MLVFRNFSVDYSLPLKLAFHYIHNYVGMISCSTKYLIRPNLEIPIQNKELVNRELA